MAFTYLGSMRRLFFLLFLIYCNTAFAQPVPPDVDSTLNALRVKKNVFKETQSSKLRIAPAHISCMGIKMFSDTLMLFSFARREDVKLAAKLDKSLLQKNKAYQYYVSGSRGNRRGFCYRGRFAVVKPHTNDPHIDSASWNRGLIYPDTSIMIVTRLHRYLVTEWKPYNADDSAGYQKLNIIFIFNKDGKLINHFTYDNNKLPLGTSVGFFNKDDLLDVVHFDRTEIINGQTNWHFKLYSLNKKGKTRERKFYKGHYSVIIPGR
jgi:hypothetical protein